MKDVNGTGFHLLLGPDDWAGASAAPGAVNVSWEAGAGSVALTPLVERFPARRGAPKLRPEDRRGADCDRYGNWYWIDTDRRAIRTWRPGRAATGYWSADALDAPGCPPDDGAFGDSVAAAPRFADLHLSGLAVTTRHHLLVGTIAPTGLLVFDLHASGPPVFAPWPPPLEIAVFDLSRAAGGGAWILDRGGAGAAARLWRLDDRLCLARLDGTLAMPTPPPPDFHPEGGIARPADAPEIPAGLDLSLPGPGGLPGASAAIAVAGLPDDTALVLDAPDGAPSRLLRYGRGGMIGAADLDAVLQSGFEGSPVTIRTHDLAFLPDPEAPAGRLRGALVVVDDQGDQAFRLTLEADAAAREAPPGAVLDLALVPDFLPLRRFGGRALVAHDGRAYYDLAESWIAIAADPRRRRRETGRLGPVSFDGGQPGTAWHRIVLDGCIPPGSSVTIEFRAADATDQRARARWETLPAPYRRAEGPETPFWTPFPGADPDRGSGSWETLVQTARGRFAEMRLSLAGDGHVTPRIRALRLHAPRFGYLERYLPAVYRDDAVSADFLERFLANVEGLFTAMEGRVAAAHGLFDTRIAPAGGLDWLAGWLGAQLGPDWDDSRRRLFMDHAELLFRWRGTPAGLKAMIDLATDPCPDAALFDGLRSGRPSEPDAARRGVRLAEGYARRILGGVALDPAPLLAGWSPAAGAGAIHAAFAQFALDRRGGSLAALADAWDRAAPIPNLAAVRFSPLLPAAAGEAEDWRAFTAGPIGFAYAAATADDVAAWQSFLSRRYASAAQLAVAHGLSPAPARITAVPLPVTLPEGGTRLADWIDFVSGVLPVGRTAHAFTVLAPVDPGEAPAARDARLGRITEVVRRERPAHTVYEVRPFWALFQAGSARLGIDTTLGAGARFAAIELGRSALGDGFIGYGHPLAVRDRTVVGRDAGGEVRL